MLTAWFQRAPVLTLTLALVPALLGCAEDAIPVPLDVLLAQQDSFEGRRIRTTGVLREFEDPHHVWIEDAGLNRVELRPPERLEGHVGQVVEVVGRFSYAPDRGRRIEVEAVLPAAGD